MSVDSMQCYDPSDCLDGDEVTTKYQLIVDDASSGTCFMTMLPRLRDQKGAHIQRLSTLDCTKQQSVIVERISRNPDQYECNLRARVLL